MDKIGFEGSYFYGCKRRKMLIDLTSAKGIAGNEDEVRSLFKKYATPYADKFLYDGLGSIIAKMLVIKKDQKSTFLGIWMKSVSWLPKSQKKAFKISNRWRLVGASDVGPTSSD